MNHPTPSPLSVPLPAPVANPRDGLLSLRTRWQLTLAVLWARVRSKSVTGTTTGPTPELLNPALWRSLQPPTGALATHVWAHALAHQPAWLNNHCLRTYAWAQAVAAIGGLSADAQLLFAASALHDLGLTPSASAPPHHCFAMRGAHHARQVLAPVASAAGVETVARAIERHLDFHVGVEDGIEAHLLQAGAMVDVLGRGLSRLPQAVRDDVLGTYPRLQMKRELCLCMQHQAKVAPHSRGGFYVRRFGFLDMIRSAPFET